MNPSATRCSVAWLSVALGLCHVCTAQESTHQDRPTSASVEERRGPLRDGFRRVLRKKPMFPRLRDTLGDLPPFLRDSELVLKPRTYYFDKQDSDGPDGDAWTYGGALAYRSGWLFDSFAVGAEGHTSQRITGQHEELTGLLEGDDGYAELGQAYGELRYREQYLSLFRRRLDLPYVNAQDSRMTPTTFEAYTLRGKVPGNFEYIAGHVAKIKPRNEDQFLTMTERAGVAGSDGLNMAGLLWTPLEGTHLGAINYYVPDTLNILYLESEYTRRLTDHLSAKVGLQFTDQRSVGADRLTRESFDTRTAGAQFAMSFLNATVRLAASATASEERIRSPWGTPPTYLSLMQRDFDRADEDAWLVGVAYDFTRAGVPGLSAFANYAEGGAARDATSGGHLPDHREVDLTLDYRVHEEWVPGLWLRVRGSVLKVERGEKVEQLRVILNYELPIF